MQLFEFPEVSVAVIPGDYPDGIADLDDFDEGNVATSIMNTCNCC